MCARVSEFAANARWEQRPEIRRPAESSITAKRMKTRFELQPIVPPALKKLPPSRSGRQLVRAYPRQWPRLEESRETLDDQFPF